MQTITRRRLLGIFGSNAEISRILGISKQAVLKWELDRPVPPLRAHQLQVLFPDRFGEAQAVERQGFWIEYRPPDQAEARA